jgi:nucleoside-diphosphate-sugar epimerase
MRVLVTGSNGNIGRVQTRRLLEEGYDLRTFDRAAGSGECEHIPGDVRDIYAVRRAVQGMEAVVHLGALAHDGAGSPEDVFGVNVQGTWNVLLACAEARIQRVVFYSSVNSLGNFGGHKPSQYLPIDDDYPHHPMTPYQLSKHLGEETCRYFSDRYGMTTICLRPVLVVNPERGWRWLASDSERREEWGKKDYWAYVDVRDVVDAALRGLTVENVKFAAFLLTADDTVADKPTADLVARHFPDTPWPKISPEAYLSDNPYRTLVDCSHAKEVLGWSPQHSWRELSG